MDLSEDELIDAIRRVLSGAGPEVIVGPGDDAAVLAQGAGELVLTADAMIEGVHFDRRITSARDLGYKAVTVTLSDIAAMGASPRAALVTLCLTPDLDAAWVMELYGGMRQACDEHALWLVGGDLARGGQIAISVTVTGEVAPGRAVTRAGARAGDVLAVTGALGASASGLRVARSGRLHADADRALLRAHLRPVARVGEGAVLARHGATAMMDVSDGLARDLTRLASASAVGATIRLRDVPVADGATLNDALGGGEDYELLVTLPGQEAFTAAAGELRESYGTPLTAIGRIVQGDGVNAVDDEDLERRLEPAGWDHFRP
ncbi:MAG: thiamine-phosphate kinase [Actinomycetota bacterium]|nr:thiamine-phosphate kinase [Actinomycetota bacterium]